MAAETILYAGGISAALLGILALLKVIWRAWRRIDQFLLDWNGEEARPGHVATRSMMERMAMVERQVTPNGGNTQTLADRVVRIERQIGAGHG